MLILPFQGIAPRIHRSAYIAPNATIIGDVSIGPDSSVFYGCVLRADISPIHIGARTNLQDNSVIHVESDCPCILDDDVTIGHMATLHGTHIEAGTLIGMHATILSRSRIGAGSIIGGGAIVLEGTTIPPRSLAAGVPAKVRRKLSAEESHRFISHAARYVTYAAQQPHTNEALNLEDVWFD